MTDHEPGACAANAIIKEAAVRILELTAERNEARALLQSTKATLTVYGDEVKRLKAELERWIP